MLRPWQAGDHPRLAAWVTDERTHKLWCANLIPFPLTREGFEEALEREAAQGARPLTAVDATGAPVGFLCLCHDAAAREGFLKYVILNGAARGRGLGTRMIREALDLAFQELHVQSVGLYVFDVNPAARRCYEKAGFALEAVFPGAFAFHDERWGRCLMRARRPDDRKGMCG